MHLSDMSRTRKKVNVDFRKGVGKGGGGGGAEASPDFKLMLLCAQAVTTKGHQKTRQKKNSFQVISNVTLTKIKAYKCPNI